jgi:hypothetical protein
MSLWSGILNEKLTVVQRVPKLTPFHGTRRLSTYLLTYLLTPWGRVLLEQLLGLAASQEIPRIYGTRKFITVFTSVRHLSLSWARFIQSPQPPSTSWRFLLILSSKTQKELLASRPTPNQMKHRLRYVSWYSDETAALTTEELWFDFRNGEQYCLSKTTMEGPGLHPAFWSLVFGTQQ